MAVANGIVVSEALVRYINNGVTLGAVNLPEVNLRSIAVDERNHARVIILILDSKHHN